MQECTIQLTDNQEIILPEIILPEKTVAKYCGKWVYFNQKQGKVAIFYCGKASCPKAICQGLFRGKRVKLLTALIPEYHLTRFFTLTLDREMDIEKAWQELPHIWSKMRKRLNRSFENFLFVAVLEAHKDGYPHIHGFMNTYVDKHDFTDMWVECGGGKITWIEKINCVGDVSEYVSKQVGRYLSKQNLCLAKCRVGKQHTLWRSLGMRADFEKKEPSGEWQLLKGNYVDNEGNLVYNVVKDSDESYRLEPIDRHETGMSQEQNFS